MKIKKTIYKGVKLSYSDQGSGIPVLLVHGYLESARIWESFVPILSEKHRVICPDLPGHGLSGVWGNLHSMENLAEALIAILDLEQLDKVFLVGHSMGGYVTMAFADLFPERLYGYSLFHSTCFSDTVEKKQNREREISLVLCDKKNQIINVNIPKAFANDNVERLSEEVAKARSIALDCPDNGVVALLNGMKSRPDRSRVLQDPSIPLLLIGGERDNYIPSEVFEKLTRLAPHAMVSRLAESGHMGFVEEPGKAAAVISEFLSKNMPE